MKIMVAVKRVIDYAVKIRVKPDKVDLSLSLLILELSKLFLCNNPKLR
jgi:electron transfer flavoprotein alpha/beta subunit